MAESLAKKSGIPNSPQSRTVVAPIHELARLFRENCLQKPSSVAAPAFLHCQTACFGLPNGLSRSLKRPVWHCKNGRFGMQNVPYRNHLWANHIATRRRKAKTFTNFSRQQASALLANKNKKQQKREASCQSARRNPSEAQCPIQA